MIASTQAIVLNKRNYGDTSLICNLFSVDHGKIAIIAKGARKIKNPIGALLQPLNYIEATFYYKETRNIQTLKEAYILHKFYEIEKNYSKMSYAFTIIDIINYIANPSQIIFRLTNKTLETLDKLDEKNVNILFAFFQLQCLKYLGYQPPIKECAKCYKKLTCAIFDFGLGQLICLHCSNRNEELNMECLNIISFLLKTHIDNIIGQFKYDIKEINKINKFLYKFFLFHIPDIGRSKAYKILNYE